MRLLELFGFDLLNCHFRQKNLFTEGYCDLWPRLALAIDRCNAERANLDFGLVHSQPAICLVCGSFWGYRDPYCRIGRNQPAAQKKHTDS